MTLITDGGSTKCDWALLDSVGNIILKTKTSGLNPAIIDSEELKSRISQNFDLKNIAQKVEVLDFYGAGCGTPTPRNNLTKVLNVLFPNAKVTVQEDLAAAVFAVTTKPGIVCILGTGSNSCYFDGTLIHTTIPSLGYVLMDEASGNYFGKRLIRDFYYKRMPTKIASDFETRFNLQADEIKLNLYKKPNANAFLASFAEFIFTQNKTSQKSEILGAKETEINPYFHNIIKQGISDFIACRILTFTNAAELPIHFIGSIAYFSQEIIKECMLENNLTLGNIIQRPVDGLVEFYRNKFSQS